MPTCVRTYLADYPFAASIVDRSVLVVPILFLKRADVICPVSPKARKAEILLAACAAFAFIFAKFIIRHPTLPYCLEGLFLFFVGSTSTTNLNFRIFFAWKLGYLPKRVTLIDILLFILVPHIFLYRLIARKSVTEYPTVGLSVIDVSVALPKDIAVN